MEALALGKAGVVAQIALIGAVLGFVALAPPATGRFMLIPITESGARRVAKLAIEQDARLVSAGPFGRSLIVEGTRSRLFVTMLRAGILPIAGFTSACGEPGDSDRG
ncbi:hypothetical protein BH09PSE4_BH09PSE4_15130 [soil metagenome]